MQMKIIVACYGNGVKSLNVSLLSLNDSGKENVSNCIHTLNEQTVYLADLVLIIFSHTL